MPHPRHRLALLLHALFFVAAATQTALVPLLPRLSHAYGLSPAAAAIVLGAPAMATLVISLPAGLIADKLGARRVTIQATLLMCAAAAAQAAPSYWGLIVGRLAFGLAFGIVWTTGVAWLASGEGAGSRQLGAVATSAAVGMVAGPGLGGMLADLVGPAAPFLLVAALAAVLAALLSLEPAVTVAPRVARDSVVALKRLAPGRPGVVSAALALTITGAVSGVTQLLVPLQLHQAGFSAGETGAAFSAAAGVYILVSAVVVRLGARATTVRVIAVTALALALALVPAMMGAGASLLIGVLLLSTAPRAVVSTVSYPLATWSSAQVGLGDGVVIGLLNGTWAIGQIAAPLAAGAIDQLAGPSPAYLAAVLPGVLVGSWLLSRARARAGTEPAVTVV